MVKDCDEREKSFLRKQKIAQYSKVYERYRVPNYRKYMRYNNSYYNNNRFNTENYNEDQFIDYSSQTKGSNMNVSNYGEPSLKDIQEIILTIKTSIVDLRKDLVNLTERVTNLENQKTNQSTSQNVNKEKNVEIPGNQSTPKEDNIQKNSQGTVIPLVMRIPLMIKELLDNTTHQKIFMVDHSAMTILIQMLELKNHSLLVKKITVLNHID